MAHSESRTTVVLAPGLIHPGPRPTAELLRLFRDIRGPEETLTRLRRPASLPHLLDHEPRGVVLYMHRQGPGDPWVTALERYVTAGGALLALHSASASIKGNGRYGDLLGGVFSGHGPVGEFPVRSTASSPGEYHFTVRDERYTHKLTGDVTVLLESDGEPVCWTHTVGLGRVACLSLGHCAGVFTHPAVGAVVKDLWTWTANKS